jgi:trehalose synthase
VKSVPVGRRPVAQLEPIIGAARLGRLLDRAEQFRRRLAGRSVWNVNSTAVGGGVAEMLASLTGYAQDLGIDTRWLVINGDADFYAITKRLHNWLHGSPGDGGGLGEPEGAHYREVLAANAEQLLAEIQPGDLVLLHDPQTAGLAPALSQAGRAVVWRCHIGTEECNNFTTAGWEFLRPHLRWAQRYVFSRREYVPPWLPADRVAIIPPSIDPFSAKNQELDAATVRSILATMGVLDDRTPRIPGRFLRGDGTSGQVLRAATVVGEGRPRSTDPLIVQVSRWDRLKDMSGVLSGFAAHVAPFGEEYLALAGPVTDGVGDDPEAAAVYADCLDQWQRLPADIRRRVLLLTLPLDDIDENAAMVNALQRHATVIVQKSLAEGFGLTVAEAMWKGRPVVASAVGGIRDQLADGTGILLTNPTELAELGSATRLLLERRALAEQMGARARAHVRDRFLGDIHLLRYAELFDTLLPESDDQEPAQERNSSATG